MVLLAVPAITILAFSHQDAAQEKTFPGTGFLTESKLVKPSKTPGESVYAVVVADTAKGDLMGEGLEKDLQGTSRGQLIDVVIAERPYSGAYIKSVKSRGYGNARQHP